MFHGLPQQLRDNLDLLATGLEVGEWDTGDSGHLHVIDHTHQFLEQSEGKVGVFQTVNRKPSSGLRGAVLKVSNNAVREERLNELSTQPVLTAYLVRLFLTFQKNSRTKKLKPKKIEQNFVKTQANV